MRKAAWLLLMLPLCIVSAASAETPISVSEFLAAARTDPLPAGQTGRLEFFRETPAGTAFIEDAEFRVSIDRFENNRQKYAVRVKPAGWGEAEAGSVLDGATAELLEARRDLLLHQALKQRYLAVVNIRYADEMIRLHRALNTLYADRKVVMKHYADTADFDPGDLAEAESDGIRIQTDLMELENQRERIVEEIRLLSGIGKDVAADEARRVTVEIIDGRVRRMERESAGGCIHLRHSESEAKAAEAEYRLEDAENRRLIRFIETAYQTEDAGDFDEAFSIEFGIRLPVGQGGRRELKRRKLESMKSRSRHLALEREIRSSIPAARRELLRLIRQYRTVKRNQAQSFTGKAFDQCLKTEGTDPLTLLKLKENMLKTDMLRTKLARMVFTGYVGLLDLTGRLSGKPLRNYLSADAEEI